MKASKFTDAQKAFIIRQGEDGIPVAEICRKAGIRQATYSNWRKKYAELTSLKPSERPALSSSPYPMVYPLKKPLWGPDFSLNITRASREKTHCRNRSGCSSSRMTLCGLNGSGPGREGMR